MKTPDVMEGVDAQVRLNHAAILVDYREEIRLLQVALIRALRFNAAQWAKDRNLWKEQARPAELALLPLPGSQLDQMIAEADRV